MCVYILSATLNSPEMFKKKSILYFFHLLHFSAETSNSGKQSFVTSQMSLQLDVRYPYWDSNKASILPRG